MHVLIIGINYRPELTGIGPYTAGLAEHLAMRGDRVTVVTGLPHYPAWRIAAGTRRRLVAASTIDGVQLLRAGHYVPTRQDALRRAAYEGSFGVTALLASMRVDRPDVVLGVVPSLSGGVLARILGRRFERPYGLLFQDLMGPAARQSGMAGGGGVAAATAKVEGWAAQTASAIGVVATSFVPYVCSHGIDPERVVHVPNWTRTVDPDRPVAEIRARFGWTPDCQVVLHAGNIGLKQGLEQVVAAARLAAARHEPIRFVLSGDGSQAADLRSAARGLVNVEFLGLQSDAMHANLLAAADVLLLSERASQVDMSLPSKLTAYYAAGRPIVAAIGPSGASAIEVERSGAGIVVPAGEPEALLGALRSLRADRARSEALAAAGRAHAERTTSARACLARAAAFVDRIAA